MVIKSLLFQQQQHHQQQQQQAMEENLSNLTSASGEASVCSGNRTDQNIAADYNSGGRQYFSSTPPTQNQPPKKKRNLPGNPDPDAEVVALSPKSLLATNRFICEICNKGFQRDQNLQLHRRGHNLPWKLKQRPKNEIIRRKVYVCPEESCVHHDPSRALGDLTGIKKHFSRKHGEKKWKCDKCSKRYAVQSDWKAHSKTCGTKEYRCDCGTLFSRRDSFITHRAFCDALAEESARAITSNPIPLLSTTPSSSSISHLNFQSHFNNPLDIHSSPLFSLKKEHQNFTPTNLIRPEIPPWLAPHPIDISSSSSCIFPTRLHQDFTPPPLPPPHASVFIWSGEVENYQHTASSYHMIMKIFAECEEFKAMWRLLDEMTEKGYPITSRTFNILICTCGDAGLARKVVERFIKSKTFNYRPLRHSYNSILHSLLVIKQYKLIEWVYEQMLLDDHSPDVLTYNVLMFAKYKLGKLDQFHRLLDEMGRNGFSPDFHTYNTLLHVLGKGDKPLAALNLLNHMREVGFDPSVIHFTTLIDGLSRAGNLDACKYFFDEMFNNGCNPDVVCYTVMITGYIVAGEFEKAHELFDEMIIKGQLPNVFTYNSMIRGFCMEGKFEEAYSMLKEMESRGCNPNFLVYSTLVSYLRNAGKLSEAHKVIRHMVEKGQYAHLVSKFKGYRRC